MPIKDLADSTILVDFPEVEELPDSRRTRRLPDDLAQLSAEAVNKAMSTIKEMAERAIGTIDDLANHPSQVELEFGVKLDAEAGALIARTGTEASISVKLVWERKKETTQGLEIEPKTRNQPQP